MDAEMYKEAIEYEMLARAIYEAILQREGVNNVNVQHNVQLAGRSGVKHQVDVFWEFRQAGVLHRVLIECKNYSSNLTLEKARNFFAVLHDVGNCSGIIVTRTGFQSGVTDFCKFYGINLKLLRKPTDADWQGRVKKFVLNFIPRVPVSNEEHPIVCNLYVRPGSDEQAARLNSTLEKSPNILQAKPTTRFLNSSGEPITDEFKWWIPKQLDVLSKPDGGPYKQDLELKDHYIKIELEEGEELVQVIGVVFEFYVETLPSEQFIHDASESVSAILKDFSSGEVEFVQKGS